jgi:hypothetical protein
MRHEIKTYRGFKGYLLKLQVIGKERLGLVV